MVVGAGLGIAGAGYVLRRKLRNRLSGWTRLPSFAATPALLPHHPERDRARLFVGRGGDPGSNLDRALDLRGGLADLVGGDDLVLVKVSAQWWNQGMTNVAAVRRLIERILAVPGFHGEVVVFENVHFRLADGSGLARAWTRPSERNVDVPGWTTLGDLVPHFRALGARVGFVGLVDAARSALGGDAWHDPEHAHGVYGGDGRGPIARGESRDGYRWDLDRVFRLQRSLVDDASTPLSWPVFTAPHSGAVVDLERGAFRREGERLVPLERRVRWLSMTTANEHSATGITAACKSAMGVVDMSCGRLGLAPETRDHQSVHFFGAPGAMWRMAGPLAWFGAEVRKPDLYLTVAEWVGVTPREGWDDGRDLRLEEAAAVRTKTVVAGVDPVAIDAWCARNLLMPAAGGRAHLYDLDDPDSQLVRFLRYYRETAGAGTLDERLVEVVTG